MEKFKEFVIDQCLEWLEHKEDVALVTLVRADGSSPRRLGSQVAVTGSGDSVGSITGGCAESAIVELALEAIGKGENNLVRFGEGSPYLDIKLPCGSSIDVFIEVGLEHPDFARITNQRVQRKPCFMAFDLAQKSSQVTNNEIESDYLHCYQATTRIVIAGNGPIVPALASLCQLLEYEVIVSSSDPETLDRIDNVRAKWNLIKSGPLDQVVYDGLTALCTVFHDHDWEPELIEQALNSDAFYVGALGSQRTHEQRKRLLASLDLDPSQIERIRAPIGLDLEANGPHEIAVAIAAELIESRNQMKPVSYGD